MVKNLLWRGISIGQQSHPWNREQTFYTPFLPPPAVYYYKYQWEIWKNTAGNSATPPPPSQPDPTFKPSVEDYFWFCFGNIDNFDVGKLGAFGTVLPPEKVLGLQPLITAGNSFFLLRSTLVQILLVYFSLFLAPKMLLEDRWPSIHPIPSTQTLWRLPCSAIFLVKSTTYII